MLLNDFYKIKNNVVSESLAQFSVEINKVHDIFNGHFPGIPVVPGVCMMQMVRELLETSLQKKLQMLSASNIKFLAVINPFENDEVDVELNYKETDNQFKTEASIKKNELVFFKMKAVFKVV